MPSMLEKFIQGLDPLVYYRFGEDAGSSTVVDDSGLGNNGTPAAAVTLGVPGLLVGDDDTAASFGGGSNARVATGYNPYTDSVTVGGVMTVANLGGATNIFGGSTGNGPLLQVQTNGSAIWWSDLGAAYVQFGGNIIAAATKYVWALEYNNVTKVAELFLNTVSQGQLTTVNPFNAAPGNLVVGGSGAANGFVGVQDEFFVVRGILPVQTLKTIYALVTIDPNPEIGADLYSDLQPLIDTWGDPTNDLLVFCNAIGKMIQPVDDIAKDGDNGEPGWSQVLDLVRAKDEWLPWLGQWVGYQVPAKAASETQTAWSARERGRIVSRSANRRATVALLREVIQEQLTGTKTVIIQERSADANTINVYVYNSEIATTTAQVQAAALAAKAAGLIMTFTVLTGANYSLLQASNATYATMTGKHANYNSVLTNPGL